MSKDILYLLIIHLFVIFYKIKYSPICEYFHIFVPKSLPLMNVSFVDSKLSDLYKGITVKERRYRYPPELIKQYIKTVKKLESVEKVEELFQFHSLNYEKLKGQQKDFSSVRINKKLQLLFHEVVSEEEPFEVNRLTITEISNFKS